MTSWNDWVGVKRSSSAWLDPAQANRMSATLDRVPTFRLGDELPQAWHWLYFHDAVPSSQLGPDGHPALGVIMPPVPLPRRMWAAGEFRFHSPLRLGDTATQKTTITSVDEKVGRTGPLFFVTVNHELEVDGEPKVDELQTIVYREMPTGPAAVGGPPAPGDAEFSESWTLTSTSLFRYSALTFNGHRIHYDADYARDIERYPGLVIHGPLLATLLLDLASRQARPVASFRYKARSPLVVPESFIVAGRADGSTTALWAQTSDGRLAMEAEARGSD